MKFWKCPSCGRSNPQEIIRCMCGYADNLDKPEEMVIKEGRNAFANDIACEENPYISVSKHMSDSWNTGWTEARKARNNYFEMLHPKVVREEERRESISKVITQSGDALGNLIDPIITFLGKAFVFLFKAAFVFAGICLAIFLIFQIFTVVSSWPSWAFIIIVLLILILTKDSL